MDGVFIDFLLTAARYGLAAAEGSFYNMQYICAMVIVAADMNSYICCLFLTYKIRAAAFGDVHYMRRPLFICA